MYNFTMPDTEKLYLHTDSGDERARKIQYYDACLKYSTHLGSGNAFRNFIHMLKKPPRMHWQMDAPEKEKELSRWKKNGWFTKLKDASDYDTENEDTMTVFSLGEAVEVPADYVNSRR